MSDTFRPITLESLAGPTPNAASTPGGYWANALASGIRSGTSEMVGLPGEWVTGLTGVTPEQTQQWRSENFGSSLLSQLAGALPAYIASSMVAAPLAALPAVARAAPWATRAFQAEQIAAAPVRALATQGVVTTVPVSAARLALTPMLGGDLERVAGSVGLDLAGSAVMGGGFGFLRGLRVGQVADDYERMLSRSIQNYNTSAPAQERLGTLLEAQPNFTNNAAMAEVIERTITGLQQTVRTERSPSLTGRRGWLGPLEGEDATSETGMRALRQDIGRLFRPQSTENFQVRTLSRGQTGFDTTDGWRAVANEVGLPNNWEQNVQYPRVVIAQGNEAARVASNLRTHLGEAVQDGWQIRREANQDLWLVARELTPTESGARRWFIGRTNAPERLMPLVGSLRRGDKLARFVGQAEENLLGRAVQGLPEDDVLALGYQGVQNRPPGLRAGKPTWDLLEHFPAPLQRAAKEAAPLAEEVWRRFKSVAAPTIHRFKDRPLASWTVAQAKSIYETAAGKANRALHGTRPVGQSPLSQIVRGLPDQGGLRKLFDGMRDSDAALVQRYAGIREAGKLDLDTALARTFDDVDNATRLRVEPVIREWDRIATAAWEEQVRTATITGTKVPKEVEGWALPHTWAGDWRQRVYRDDGGTHIVGGRTREQALRNAEAWVEEHGGRLQASGPFRTDADGDFILANELRGRRLYPDTPRVGVNQPGNVKTRKAKPTGGYQGDPNGPTLTKEELWNIMSGDISLKYRDIAQRTVDRLLGTPMLNEIMAKYGRATGMEVAQVLRSMRGEQGEFARWQNKALSPLDNFLGKNSASKIAAAVNAAEAHLAFGFGNLSFSAGNAVTFLQTVAPKIALTRQLGMRGETDRVWQLFDFMPSFGPNGLPNGAFASISPLKLGKAALQDLVNPSPQHLKLFNRAVEEGVVAARTRDEFLGQKSRLAQNWRSVVAGEEPVTNMFRLAAGVNMALPHRVEELTRAHSFFTWLRVAEALNLTEQSAYELAKRGTWATMYGYAQADRPRLFTGPVGMMAGLFKNWMINYMADLGLYAREAARGNWNGLMWALGSSTALAGVGGLPLYAAVDQFQRLFSNKPLMEELYGAVDNTQTADALYYGLPALFGVSLQGMMAAPLNDPRRDVTFMFNAVSLDRAKRIANAAGDAWNLWSAGGENPLTYDRTWDQLVYAMGPRTLYRGFAQVEDGALKSIRNGRPIIEGITPLERTLNALGFAPTSIARAWEASETLWEDQERRRATTTQMAEAYHRAWEAQDGQAMHSIILRAVAEGADLSAVMRGAMQRQRGLVQPQVPFEYLSTPGAVQRLQTLRVGI